VLRGDGLEERRSGVEHRRRFHQNHLGGVTEPASSIFGGSACLGGVGGARVGMGFRMQKSIAINAAIPEFPRWSWGCTAGALNSTLDGVGIDLYSARRPLPWGVPWHGVGPSPPPASSSTTELPHSTGPSSVLAASTHPACRPPPQGFPWRGAASFPGLGGVDLLGDVHICK